MNPTLKSAKLTLDRMSEAQLNLSEAKSMKSLTCQYSRWTLIRKFGKDKVARHFDIIMI